MNEMLKTILTTLTKLWNEAKKYRKAIISGVVAFVFSYLSRKSHGLTEDDWTWIITQTLAAAGLVWAIPNKKV